MNQMQLPMAFGTPPAARRRDPATSHVAAATARELQREHHSIILAALERYGAMSKTGIAARTRLDAVQVCRRLSELQRIDLIELTGATTPSTSGRPERVWRLKA